jgi:hypothetical protein
MEDDLELDLGFDYKDQCAVELDIDMSSFDGLEFSEEQTRYIKPKAMIYDPRLVKYENAKKLAKEHYLDFGQRIDCIVAGSFIFGDYLEAYLTEYNVLAKEMIITTLSMSQDNIDSLNALMEHKYIDKLSIIISDYFYSHERHRAIPYIYKMLDKDDRFQLSVAGIHTKTCQFLTEGGRKVVMHGSANLRPSQNLEQFTIEENPALYDFYYETFKKIEDKYHTINKAVRVKKLWDCITEKKFDD